MAVVASPVVERFAALHARLGGVPLDRIILGYTPGTATEADLWEVCRKLHHKLLFELIDGMIVEKAMGSLESLISSKLLFKMGTFAEQQELGVTLGEAGGYRLREGLIRIPDISFIPDENLPDVDELTSEDIMTSVPTLIVEVLSPSNTRAEIDRKLNEFFAIGTKLAWVIDPATRLTRVHTSVARFKVLTATGVLDGGRVLPGFKLPLADLFAATRPRKKR